MDINTLMEIQVKLYNLEHQNDYAEKIVLEKYLKSFERVDPETGEPLSLRSVYGTHFVRLKGGEYTDGKILHDSFEKLLESQFLPVLETHQQFSDIYELSLSDEKYVRSRKEVKALEKGIRLVLIRLRVI